MSTGLEGGVIFFSNTKPGAPAGSTPRCHPKRANFPALYTAEGFLRYIGKWMQFGKLHLHSHVDGGMLLSCNSLVEHGDVLTYALKPTRKMVFRFCIVLQDGQTGYAVVQDYGETESALEDHSPWKVVSLRQRGWKAVPGISESGSPTFCTLVPEQARVAHERPPPCAAPHAHPTRAQAPFQRPPDSVQEVWDTGPIMSRGKEKEGPLEQFSVKGSAS